MFTGQLVKELGGVLDKTLGSLLRAGDRCALLDYPGYSNVGDSAIWLGQRACLDRLGIVVTYVCDTSTYSEERLRSKVGAGPILFTGGGNLGDLWPRHQKLREAIIRAFPDNKIIQLPQTIWFEKQVNLARARAAFNSHSDLTILVRDQRSRDLAQSEFRATALLCPDMAFALGSLPRSGDPDRDFLCLLRQDIESISTTSGTAVLKSESVDWLTDQPSVRLQLNRFLVEQQHRHPRCYNWAAPALASLRARLWQGLALERVQRGCALLSRAKVVITDRLHGHILSLLLGIPHIVLDNNYGKISSFYETWTQTSELAHWAETRAEAAALARDLIANAPEDRELN
ncbi:MAG: polysaccharide pyruvyl transferase family protein [Gammaproteobacteria bacterium]|nr:polysaccharide pyruvyl transferase family protein [Gammaproteobacteria bacterium]